MHIEQVQKNWEEDGRGRKRREEKEEMGFLRRRHVRSEAKRPTHVIERVEHHREPAEELGPVGLDVGVVGDNVRCGVEGKGTFSGNLCFGLANVVPPEEELPVQIGYINCI